MPLTCNEEGQYFDRKTEKCINFIDVSDMKQDLVINNVDVSYNHNYGMAFWILLDDPKVMTKSIDFIWQYHMRISLQYDSTFKAYCFPQNYEPYSITLDDDDIPLSSKATSDIPVINSAMNEYTEGVAGTWTWFQCFLSYNNKYFYLNENRQTLQTETLYREGNTEFKNDQPLGWFFNKINSNTKSNLTLRVTQNPGKKLYMRCFYLFKDFLPYNYNFKYMDMSLIGSYLFPPLTLAINFADYNFDTHKLKYQLYSSLINKLETKYYPNINFYHDFILSLNFVFLPLCNPIDKEKFNSEISLCEEIILCDETELNCHYCMEEKTPLICRKNYYINIASDGAVTCENECVDKNYFRTPGSNQTTGICGTDCLSVEEVLKTCPNSASSILTYQSDFECKEGFNRIGYQCIQEPTKNLPNKGALFYSGINYPYNIKHSFGSDVKNALETNYIIEFWFMIDNALYTDFTTDEKYHYFFIHPHEIYLKKDSDDNINYYYRFYPSLSETLITPSDLINKYEWNKILIFPDKDKKEVKLIINFDKAHPVITSVGSSVSDSKFYLSYIIFCTYQRSSTDSLKYPQCQLDGIKWASAYYNNIRIWDLKVSTIDTIQSFVNGIYTEYPKSLILFYPLTIKYLDNNQMSNIMPDYEEHIISQITSTNSHLYNKDNIIIYNYSTKFDWGLLHQKQFVSTMDSKDHKIDPNDPNNKCNEHCVRCFKTDDVTECYECEEGFVLQYKECKDARKLYFLKTPSGTSGASYIFKTKNKDGKDFLDLTSFTLIFWMKFFGIKYPVTTENNRIMSIDANTFLAYRRSTNELVMMENSKTMFIDGKFRDYFGIWIPISIANYISNANNYVYPNMFTLSVNKIDIPFADGYGLIPESGIKITELSFGSDIIALFAELSIYSKFIQGGYGRIRSLEH